MAMKAHLIVVLFMGSVLLVSCGDRGRHNATNADSDGSDSIMKRVEDNGAVKIFLEVDGVKNGPCVEYSPFGTLASVSNYEKWST
jgi:major membrane immunogen (membrane-anchored lipoprotein)